MSDPWQRAYWDRVAGEKRFSHPVDAELLARHAPRSARVLDVGSGYGRTLAELHGLGTTNAVGIDTSAGMIARGRAAHPHLDLRHVEPGPLPFEDASFELALLFAVLTSIPSAEHQAALVAEVERVLVPGGLIFVSDLWLQDDDRNRARYAAGERANGTRGVFELPEGAVFRHHDEAWLADLASGWERLSLRDLEVTTMNGNAVRAFQLLARCP